MTPAQKREVVKAIAKIDRCKKVIGKERDKLRDYLRDLEDIFETLDVGTECLNDGITMLYDGIDKMSELL